MKSVSLITVVACGLFLAAAFASEEVVLKTSKGNIRGVRVDTDTGLYYYSFRGVRYAQPPIGDLRLQDPVDVEDYEDEFDATDDGNVCPQFAIGSNEATGDEDCLNLNVYSPKLDKKKRAVIVYFHGGSFVFGAGASYTYGPEFLLENDVVVVSVNYRIGALGFLATSDKAATGNFGIKDQILALKWVRKNVANFGGDPDNVTLMGDDAGAASVSIHTLSPASAGLFNKAILISGNVLCDQFLQREPQKAAEELASRMECTSMKGEDIVDCLRRQTQQDIVKTASDMTTFFSFPRFFVPVIDGEILPDEPEKLLSSGKFNRNVRIMSGQNKDDGAFYYRLLMNVYGNNGMGGYDDNFLDHKLPRLLPTISRINSKLYPITRLVRKKYFLNVDMDDEEEFRPKFNEFLTDLLYTRCVSKFNNLAQQGGVPSVHAFSFDYRGQYSIVNLQGETADMGVSAGDQLQYVFSNIWGDDMKMSNPDLKFIRNVWVPMITNFAKTSDPVPKENDSLTTKWTPLAQGQNNVLRVGETIKMETDWKKGAEKFWQEDVPKLFVKKAAAGKGKRDEL